VIHEAGLVSRPAGVNKPTALSAKEALILRLLLGGRELYGLELVKNSNSELKRGTVYTTLNRMEEDKGLVASRQEERTPEAVGLPRRLYKITALGERTLRALEAAEVHVGYQLPVGATS
jgi:DNA-binding PadR family transcriptional regulator